MADSTSQVSQLNPLISRILNTALSSKSLHSSSTRRNLYAQQQGNCHYNYPPYYSLLLFAAYFGHKLPIIHAHIEFPRVVCIVSPPPQSIFFNQTYLFSLFLCGSPIPCLFSLITLHRASAHLFNLSAASGFH
ncbi:hypothetical protein CRM22_002399 [Opisthorchis felineus]|uniref:Uncharacterized protein n=1 Tax=Opisthorchis felineus TaxID=147828 RepID=A0A4V3SGD4_OPIFE|nr:hypothetical protein CRM22_002399 [Opisthorchis felineus]